MENNKSKLGFNNYSYSGVEEEEIIFEKLKRLKIKVQMESEENNSQSDNEESSEI